MPQSVENSPNQERPGFPNVSNQKKTFVCLVLVRQVSGNINENFRDLYASQFWISQTSV